MHLQADIPVFKPRHISEPGDAQPTGSPSKIAKVELSLRRGVPVEVVSKQMRHSTVAFTLTQYRTVYRAERERWALDMDDIIPGAKEGKA
ncbi:hypothetical protein DESA109040_17175 [Deinococcus saxicola]